MDDLDLLLIGKQEPWYRSVKRGKIRNFKRNGKVLIIIIIINYQNGLGKPRKFSRSQMTKRTAPLNSSREI